MTQTLLRKNAPLIKNLVAAMLAAACLLAGGSAWGGVEYADPAGGWRYTYDGSFNAAIGAMPPGYGTSNGSGDALDGTWAHDQGDKWDGTGPGDPLSDPTDPAGPASTPEGGPAGTSPGGAASLLEGSTNYIRIQDTGNPEEHGWTQGGDPENTNRRVYFGHNMQQDGALVGNQQQLVIDTGMTVSFRARIPNSGPLDDIYLENLALAADFDEDVDVDGRDFLTWQQGLGTDAGPGMVAPRSAGNANADQFVNGDDLAIWQEEFGSTNSIPWLKDAPNGRGRAMTRGRGMINIVQNQPTSGGQAFNEDTMISFSLVNSVDIEAFCGFTAGVGSLCAQLPENGGSGMGGLIMNNLNGIVSDAVDSISPGLLNIVEISDADLNEWHEFWITMKANGGAPGATAITIYMDGDTNPVGTFNATLAGPGNASYADQSNPYLEFGISENGGLSEQDGKGGFGAFDMDFFSYKLDVIVPTAAPLASTANVPEPASLLLLALGLLMKRNRTLCRMTA